ncbi:MAG: molybdopterin biosynthesis protein MoeB [Candidatus Dactylopiibacterium carminicum]|uniref:Molybdopterin-synthase adenylyltransferase n=1 Tax=Candidatus Dactylopiibacterium carminicum TaxID=857335 RepID=A0A272EUV0_9RHOO|nr:molybdopterin-synthase adenylyltransferase MoeB [Candidatus Dactylopiibacterium carminicum]KAF7600336.1 molybdopterin-synthase adenylyltransferase MoeB [Candidatus Dactylopiibacterium carminicum]PAS93836.1 MAG: molybdopterin biosynthesis protein MoeB [Candidatus Dactylopiibacterium carminicum]PAS95629.1 MAG: molybdopterin biosynthesis protein MoeB [Candidatus Dactylopiibacterium carminicum]PAT00339.1 MAG: molybdopterin biosynthesis protein MoeB [Candidatus Dactylopiibacterium carminicum]
MDDQELLRYSRHILLPEIDVAGQEAIRAARVLIVGAGGLGSPAALYLAAAGVGQIVLCDGDEVDLSNLQRQILHELASVGENKAKSGKRALERINPLVRVHALPQRLDAHTLIEHVAEVDVVLDCCDNFVTRHAVNRACVQARKPLVSGSAIRFDGQLAVFDLRDEGSACYHCLFPDGEEVAELRCAVTGVFAPLTGIIGASQAAEALKLIAGFGQSLQGRLLLLDGLRMRWREVRYGRDASCAVCGAQASCHA